MAKVNIKQIVEDSFVRIVEALTDIKTKNIPVRRGLDYEDNLGKWQIIVIAEYSPAYPNAPLYDITVNLIAMMHNEDDLSGDNTSEEVCVSVFVKAVLSFGAAILFASGVVRFILTSVACTKTGIKNSNRIIKTEMVLNNFNIYFPST